MTDRNQDIPPAIGKEPGGKPWTNAAFRARIRGAIRKVYFLWPGRKAVVDRTRVVIMVRKKDGSGDKKAVWYKCEQCERLCKPQLTPKQNALIKPWKKECTQAKKKGLPLPERPDVPYRIWCDHKDPVVGVEGSYPDWHTYIFRTFSDPLTTMWAICDVCHQAKSAAENSERRENVKSKKHPS